MMKLLKQRRQLSTFLTSSIKPFSSQPIQTHKALESSPKTHGLTDHHLTKLNLLIPRLCLSGNLSTAIHLATTALFTTPPPSLRSLSLPILLHSLSSLPDTSKSFSLLTLLSHSPSTHPHLTLITFHLIISYLKHMRAKEALTVYKWLLRPNCPCQVDKRAYGVLVCRLLELGFVFEGMRVVRDMVCARMLPGVGLRSRIYRCLLREARVVEAVAFDEAICACFEVGNHEDFDKVVRVLDSLLANWKE